jgi:DNA polymerase II small subunit
MATNKEKKILEFLEKGILLSPDVEQELDALDADGAQPDLLLLDKENKGFRDGAIDWRAFDEAKVRAEKHANGDHYEKIVELAKAGEFEESDVRVVRSYAKKSRKRTYGDFVSYFNQRFKALSAILQQRSELRGATAIARLARREAKETVAIIGMVKEKSTTKSGSVMFTVEDQTGEIKALAAAQKREVLVIAHDMVLDEVVGIIGTLGDGIIFINELVFPDVPVTHEVKKGPEEAYLAIVGDPQVGGKEFLSKDFAKLIAWFNGCLGSDEQRAIAAKVKYLVVIGDLVEGVGVYPGQEDDLLIKDIKEQYAEFTSLVQQLPRHIQVLCIPGNHDAVRGAEPQLPIYKDFAADLYAMENVTMLSNPAFVTIGAKRDFAGFDLLLYHGSSLIYYADNVPSIRERGGQKRAELIMKFLLQRRHLAPTHGSNTYIPDPDQDPLLIDRIPDLFITGHIHRMASATYRGVTMINASAWCDVTENQEKRGLEPQPARLPLVNLQTRDVKVINFYSGKGKGFLEPDAEPQPVAAGAALARAAQHHRGAS